MSRSSLAGPARWLRWARPVAVVLALTLIAAACGGDDTTNSTVEGDTGSTTASGSEGVEILVWFDRDYIPSDEFAQLEADTGMNVSWDVRPSDSTYATLLQMQAAGEKLPDVIEEDTSVIPGYVEAGLLLPLDDLLVTYEEEAPEDFSVVHPSVWEDGTIDGQVYQAAILGNFAVLYFDPEAFEEAGITAPIATWDGVLEAARALKATFPDEYPFPVPANSEDYTNGFLQQMRSIGVPFNGPIPDLESEQGLYIIEWYQTMVAEGLIDPAGTGWTEDDSRGAFLGRRASLLMEGLSTAKDFHEIPDYEYGTGWSAMIMPRFSSEGSEEGTPSIVPRGLSIVASTEHPYEASLALRYLIEEEHAVSRTINGSQPPRLTSPMSGLDDFMPHFTPEIREAFFAARPNPTADNIYDIEAVFTTLLHNLVGGDDRPAAEIAAEYQAQFDALVS